MRCLSCLFVITVLGAVAGGSAVAQTPDGRVGAAQAAAPGAFGRLPPRPLPVRSAPAADTTVRSRAFLASLVAPGTGQYMLGQKRWIPYAAVETYGWLRFAERRLTASRLAERYRDLAWTAARAAGGGMRRDTSFAYYEILTKSMRSGAFDADPAMDGLQPEQDPATYNGEQWRLAKALFVPLGSAGTPGTPGYGSALGYYMATAIPDDFAFAWQSEADQGRFRELIEDSDDAYSGSTIVLGLILANHLTSSVDALITSRLRRSGKNLRFESGIAPDDRGDGWHAPLRLDASVRYAW
ncbi:MAG TPA: hypothetical protein VF035_01140 [Longimicrobiales bacterium]